MVFYRKYRPQTFAELIGQDHIAQAFTRAIANDSLAHAYIFCGPRGLGKTSTARIIAKAINCQGRGESSKGKAAKEPNTALAAEPCNACAACIAITQGSHLDVIEIDAASNRGIDDIRELKERITLSPTTASKKIYIIDEVHMLTTEAFNALLKTLEEPPAHAILILATTEAHKVPQTILSRCERFDFQLASAASLAKAITSVCQNEHVTISDEAVASVATLAEGSFRDAIKLIDQLASLHEPITESLVAHYYKMPQRAAIEQLATLILSGDITKALQRIGMFDEQGYAIKQVTVGLLQYLREQTLAVFSGGDPKNGVSVTSWLTLLKAVSVAEKEMRLSPIPALPLELALVEWSWQASSNHGPVIQEKQPKASRVNKLEVTIKEPTIEQEKPTVVTITEIGAQKQAIAPEELGAMLADSSDSIVMIEEPLPVDPTQSMPLDDPKPIKKMTITKLQETWPTIVHELLTKNHSAGLLIKNAAIDDFDGETITLSVAYKFHKERLEHESIRAILETHLAHALGKSVVVTCVLKEKAKRRGDTDDLTDQAQQIFGAELL